METKQSKWQSGALLICDKCGKRTSEDLNHSDFADGLKSEVKALLREQDRSQFIRPMISSCLGTCPKDKQAACWLPQSGVAEMVEFDFHEKKSFIDWLNKK
jgi:hypothetical protein